MYANFQTRRSSSSALVLAFLAQIMPALQDRLSVLKYLEASRTALSDLIVDVLVRPPTNHPLPFLLADLTTNCPSVLSTLHSNSRCRDQTLLWGHKVMSKYYSDAIGRLAHDEPDWHFNATHAKPSQIRDFRLEDMAKTVQQNHGRLWSLFYQMVTGFADTEEVSDEQAKEGLGDEEEDAVDETLPSSPITRDELNQRKHKVRHARVVVSYTASSAR